MPQLLTGRKVRSRATKQSAKELVQVDEKNCRVAGRVGSWKITGTIQKVDGHSSIASTVGGCGSTIKKWSQATICCQYSSNSKLGISQHGQIDNGSDQCKLIVGSIIAKESFGVLDTN